MIRKVILAMVFITMANAAEIVTVKKTIQYRKDGSFDFSGSVIKSKVRTPEVFYVFRRKRTAGGELNIVPNDFMYYHNATNQLVRDTLKK